MIRVAGAPISWGVCEVPGWGWQLPAERVLAEMRDAGLAATEFGPDGFLPEPPDIRAELLRRYGLEPVGGFVPVVLHDPSRDPVPDIDKALDAFGPGTILVLAAATGLEGYDERPTLDAAAWMTLLRNLERVASHAAGRGHRATLHPHVGTVVERRDEVMRVLDGSTVPLCLDTGHLLIGGTDPRWLADQVPDRIAHVHLKDVDDTVADRVRQGELTYTQAVLEGMYRPLGTGDVDVAGIVRVLSAAGYDGWYVLEQDTVLGSDPAPGTGPLDDVRAGVAFLRDLVGEAS